MLLFKGTTWRVQTTESILMLLSKGTTWRVQTTMHLAKSYFSPRPFEFLFLLKFFLRHESLGPGLDSSFLSREKTEPMSYSSAFGNNVCILLSLTVGSRRQERVDDCPRFRSGIRGGTDGVGNTHVSVGDRGFLPRQRAGVGTPLLLPYLCWLPQPRPLRDGRVVRSPVHGGFLQREWSSTCLS